MAHGDPIFAQVVPKNSNCQRFQQNLFRTTGFQLKFLILIEFPNILHWKAAKKSNQVWSWGKIWAKLCPIVWKKYIKKQAISLGFFYILLGEYLLKQIVVVLKPPEWKFMAIIARMSTFKACVCYFLSNFYFSPNDSPSKTEKYFLFHLKSSFRS